MTERLYERDSHMAVFEATVTACRWNETRDCYEIFVDKTAFFPEGGGQEADTGTLGGVEVFDVQEEAGEVVHLTREALEVGVQVCGELDYETRFSKMQQHTGEHIVSGLVHRHFGYDNVGFHLGKELVTMDYNGGLTREELKQIEWEANQAVAANVEVLVTYPTKEELSKLTYRSKKELDGQVRIVTIPGYDVCACCAPQVVRTGEIGMIRLIDAVRYKGGTRVTMVCGFRALQDYWEKEDSVKEISRMLSAKPSEIANAVKRLQGEMQQWKDKLYRMQSAYLDQRLEEIQGDETCFLLFEEELDRNLARKFVDAAMKRTDGVCGAFLGDDTHGYQYILGSSTKDVKRISGAFHQVFAGKGGGKPEMVQGSVQGNRQELEACLCKISEM